jgi:hypothetical protein
MREPIKVIADILASELALPPGQVMLSYEAWDIPPTPGLYIALAYIAEKVLANNNYPDDDGAGGFLETQQVVMLHDIQIDAMSFDDSARLQKEQIVAAIHSVAAQQAMDENGISIARIPSGFSNTSSLEASKMLNRFSITIRVSAVHTFTKTPPYYDNFKTPEVHVNA